MRPDPFVSPGGETEAQPANGAWLSSLDLGQRRAAGSGSGGPGAADPALPVIAGWPRQVPSLPGPSVLSGERWPSGRAPEAGARTHTCTPRQTPPLPHRSPWEPGAEPGHRKQREGGGSGERPSWGRKQRGGAAVGSLQRGQGHPSWEPGLPSPTGHPQPGPASQSARGPPSAAPRAPADRPGPSLAQGWPSDPSQLGLGPPPLPRMLCNEPLGAACSRGPFHRPPPGRGAAGCRVLRQPKEGRRSAPRLPCGQPARRQPPAAPHTVRWALCLRTSLSFPTCHRGVTACRAEQS